MARQEIIESPIPKLVTIEVSSDPMLDSLITFVVEAKADIALLLPPALSPHTKILWAN
ncbi:hypothetical protein OIU35_17690 [Boseaceae bacterium BT-24-1]|nr:hypothetical protein [Boseaceae bacterium BT-24-1]